MTYYAGLDVSLRSTNICVIDDDGELLTEGKTDKNDHGSFDPKVRPLNE